MQELYEQVSERLERVQQVIRGPIGPQRFRALKEEQKLRCEKENFIISMMRANKSVQIISKSLYFRFSLEIMRKINPEFRHEMSLQRIEENFLNDFVGLYRHFFFKYEEMFNFKLKIQNLIRPTNHNLIVDLVKYLLDFSRDYYQQMFFWYMKSLYKEEGPKDLDESLQEEKDVILPRRIERTSFNQITLQRAISKKEETEPMLKKDCFKAYDVLEIGPLPALANQTKDPATVNVEVLKMRINEIYRDMKSRNTATKNNTQVYFSRYNIQRRENNKDYQQSEDEAFNRAVHPFRLTLVIQKNGFNYISVALSENRYYSKPKDKRLSPLKLSQRVIPQQSRPKLDYMLTSLKIIRISENFLPPIPNQSALANATVNLPFLQNNSRINLLSSNSANNEEESRKPKKQSFHHGTESNLSSKEEKQKEKEKIMKEKSSRKLSQIKKNFRSEEKRQGGILPVANTFMNRDDPEKKIYDWLEKLRQIKEIERRKIMGLG